MRINIRTKYLELGKKLKELIFNKFSQLKHLLIEKPLPKESLKKKKEVPRLWVEISKVSLKHKKGPYFYVEAQLELPGKNLRAELESENLESAINEIAKEIQRQIEVYKTKKIAQYKRGARKLKRMTRVAKGAKSKEGKRVLVEGLK
ncbi:HPF/RaiA family ribosome-associated protein [Candidatus Parcubacteria bacterium]|nr:HPF/RaiA family ribosome-associated protein [Candidatus Parcubacteria bacterium]